MPSLMESHCRVSVAMLDPSVRQGYVVLSSVIIVPVVMLLACSVVVTVAACAHAAIFVFVCQNAPVNAAVTFDILNRDKFGNARTLDDILWITVETSERVDITNVTWSYVRADTYAVSYVPLTLGKVHLRVCGLGGSEPTL